MVDKTLKFVIKIDIINDFVSGRVASCYASTVNTINDMSSFYRGPRLTNGKEAYSFLASFSIYESYYDGFIDPAINMIQSYEILFNASSILFTKVLIKLDALTLIIGEAVYDYEYY